MADWSAGAYERSEGWLTTVDDLCSGSAQRRPSTNAGRANASVYPNQSPIFAFSRAKAGGDRVSDFSRLMWHNAGRTSRHAEGRQSRFAPRNRTPAGHARIISKPSAQSRNRIPEATKAIFWKKTSKKKELHVCVEIRPLGPFFSPIFEQVDRLWLRARFDRH